MASKSSSIPTRTQSDPATQWRTQDIFASDEAFLEAVDRLKAQGAQLAEFRGALGEERRLLAFLKQSDQLTELLCDVSSYAGLKADEDTANATYQGYSGMVTTALVELSAALAFVTPEILALGDTVLDLLGRNSELAPYRKYLEDILRQRAHILPEREEVLLSLAGELAAAPEEAFSMLNNADMKFGDIEDEEGNAVQLTHGRYIQFLESEDRRVRKDAFEALYKVYGDHSNTLASLLSSHVRKNKFLRTARNYNSCLEMCLDGNKIPTEVYRSLIEAVHGAFPAFYDYMELRRSALKLDELHCYDLYTPIVHNPFKEVSYRQAQKMVLEALAPLGADYCSRIERAYRDGWIDVYENEGKRSGAYSNGNPTSHPFVLLNHQDNLESAFTLAHELGHALHSDYSNQHQIPTYRNYSIFVAEVASTVNEALLLRHLMERGDRAELTYLYNHYLEQFRATLFRQTMFAEFELSIHEIVEGGATLTSELLDDLYGELCTLYFGPGVVQDDQIRKEWSRIPHFYYDFYVYQYATGFAAAQAIADRILTANGAAEYLEFLKLGDSVYPLEALRVAGVDLATPQPVGQALKVFEQTLRQLQELLRE